MADEKPSARALTDEELAAPIGAIPVPPEALFDELDNDLSAPAAAKPAAEVDVAVLDFVDGAPVKRIALRHPFRLDGRVVDAIDVRPLTVAQTSSVIESITTGRVPENIDFYALMTGLPAAVLRALPGLDGEEVTAAAHGFLPRFMKDDVSSPTRDGGGA